MSNRYSSPPTEAKLLGSTESLTKSLDVLAARVGGEPTPLGLRVASIEPTDEQRLAVLRELRQRLAFSADGLREYEAEVRGRLGR